MKFLVVNEVTSIVENIVESDAAYAIKRGLKGFYNGVGIGKIYDPLNVGHDISALAAQLAQSDDTAISLYEKQLAQDTINADMDDALIALYERGGTK